MSAAAQTWTLDVAGLKYIDKDKIEHVINTNETLTLTFRDTGTGGVFTVTLGGGQIVCTDGFSFIPDSETRFQMISSEDSLTVGAINGEMCFVEQDFARHPFRVTRLNMANADGVGANNIVEITFESILHGGIMTWTNINTA